MVVNVYAVRVICCRNRLLMCILNICKEHLGSIPKVVGMDVVEMAIWAKVCISLLMIRRFLCMSFFCCLVTMTKLVRNARAMVGSLDLATAEQLASLHRHRPTLFS
jgi:hypothetical protein